MATPSPVRERATDADALAATALDLLAFDTSNPPGDTREIVEYVERRLSDAGLDTERVVADPAKPNLLATLPGERPETLLLDGHLDTVPFDRGEWTRDPLGEFDADERAVYGRGATDMKGPVAAMLEVAEAFVSAGVAPPVTLAFAFVSDEEVGGDAGLPAVLDRGLDADACVIGEPTCERGRHSVTVADRGSIWLTLSASGVGAHGSRPALGENAIDRLWAGISAVRDLLADYPLGLDPALDPIVEDSVAFYEPLMGEQVARETFAHPTVNLGTVAGGTVVNAVPDSATARLDVRLTASVHTPDVLADVERAVADVPGVEIADASWSVGTYEAPDSPVVEATAAAAEAATGERIYRRSATGGGDAKTLRNAGIPTVEFALGTDTVHAPDEYLPVESLVENAEAYARLPYEFADALDREGVDDSSGERSESGGK